MADVVTGTPLTDFFIYGNVGLDNSYQDTLTFANASSQKAYFDTKVITSFSNIKPVRTNIVRVNMPVTALETASYCSFLQSYSYSTNTYTGSRRWYAFITSVEYINPIVTEITFEIDVIQSNLFYWNIGTSYVEREHTNTDAIGEWVLPEPFSLSESDYFYDWIEKIDFGNVNTHDVGMGIAVWFQDGSHLDAKQVSGIFTGTNVAVYPDTNTGRQQLSDWLDSLGENIDKVVNITMMPYVGSYYPSGGNFNYSKRWNAEGVRSSYYGYNPKNNKCFTYPYHSACVFNSRGECNEYKFELMRIDTTGSAALHCQWAMSPDICVIATIDDYTDDPYARSSGMLTETGFPQCAWNVVSYQAWLSQITSDVFGFAAGMATGIGTGSISSAAQAVTNGMNLYLDLQHAPMKKAGSMCGCSTNYNRLGFYIYSKNLQKDVIESIDNFFTRFGYRVEKNKIPNIRGREYFNYVKTKSLNIKGNIPRSDISRIKSIFNNGITFWHNERGHDVGDNYSGNPII